jgi:valyl-tRNA synthetase
MEKAFDAEKMENKWREFWEKNNIYAFDPKSKKPVFSIDVPPPYASAGHLHIGHALHYTQFEIIARMRRMAGYNVHFAPCFDNNGLPTEKYVEEKFNISKSSTTKTEFRKLCLEESRKVEKSYADRVFKKLGHSYDWNLLYTTIDPEAQKVAQMSFIDLFRKGLVYRSEEPTLWCTHHQTALAQAEVEDLQRNTKLNHIYFDLERGGKIEIATTRPEFLASCVAIFVHPNDKRHKKLVGKKVIVPIFDYRVPVLTDETVDPEFGSGIMMVCTFGDTADIEKWKKHKLPTKVMFDKEGRMNDLGGPYKGLTLKEAQERIIHDLKKEGRLFKQEELSQTVGSCWRCSTPIEYIITKQWFIKTLDFKKQLVSQGRKIKWYPDFYRHRYEDWTNNLAWDWCISRQRFYGIPIPVWYCKKCNNVMVADEKDIPVDPEVNKPKACKCGSKDFVPEKDVFDTWMTSSMSPEIAIRWLEKPQNFRKMFPTSLRPQSHDIIRTWAFYTILKAYHHFREIPWKEIALGTYVLDPKGRGMHKSKGNALWTEDLLAKYSVDVVRYWVGTATFGEDLPFQERVLVTGQRFLTKLWNASRFVLMHLEGEVKKPELELIDRWLLSKLNDLTKNAKQLYFNYKTGEANRQIEQFFWHTFCDHYLEIVKDRLYNQGRYSKEAVLSAKYTLHHALLAILKMLAPVVPFITEEIYHSHFSKFEGKSIHMASWPEYERGLNDKKAEKVGDMAVDLIAAIRKYKADKRLSMAEPLKEVKVDSKEIKPLLDVIGNTIRAERIAIGKAKMFETQGNIKFDIK